MSQGSDPAAKKVQAKGTGGQASASPHSESTVSPFRDLSGADIKERQKVARAHRATSVTHLKVAGDSSHLSDWQKEPQHPGGSPQNAQLQGAIHGLLV